MFNINEVFTFKKICGLLRSYDLQSFYTPMIFSGIPILTTMDFPLLLLTFIYLFILLQSNLEITTLIPLSLAWLAGTLQVLNPIWILVIGEVNCNLKIAKELSTKCKL
jgi:hypothetical protein